jgi:hypothetical protein
MVPYGLTSLFSSTEPAASAVVLGNLNPIFQDNKGQIVKWKRMRYAAWGYATADKIKADDFGSVGA